MSINLTIGNQRTCNADSEWISLKAGSTRTDGTVIVDSTNSVGATWSRSTWVTTFHIYTGQCGQAFGAADTFWSTSRRTSNIFGKTATHSLIVNLSTLTI